MRPGFSLRKISSNEPGPGLLSHASGSCRLRRMARTAGPAALALARRQRSAPTSAQFRLSKGRALASRLGLRRSSSLDIGFAGRRLDVLLWDQGNHPDPISLSAHTQTNANSGCLSVSYRSSAIGFRDSASVSIGPRSQPLHQGPINLGHDTVGLHPAISTSSS